MSEMLYKYSHLTGLRESAIIYRFLIKGFSKINFNDEELEIIKKNNVKYDVEQNRISDMGRIYTVINSHKKITDFIIKNNRVSRKKVNIFMVQKIIKGEVERIAKCMQKEEIESYEEIIDKWVFCLESDKDCENYIFEVTKDYIDNQNNDKGFFKHRK